ncbi:MAG: hypothetical protein HY360_19170 [Verrucomicrobia bacterium]|nr:hypothetical protein [Verrucomicrobiota bacterium]
MKVPYPKNPRDIPIRIVNRGIEDGMMSGIATTAEVRLNEKLDDYLLRLGYSSAHITGIMVQLLTKTKVRVDFREYTERIELVNPEDQLSSTQAISLLEDYITAATGTDDSLDKVSSTQRILVQGAKPPRK